MKELAVRSNKAEDERMPRVKVDILPGGPRLRLSDKPMSVREIRPPFDCTSFLSLRYFSCSVM